MGEMSFAYSIRETSVGELSIGKMTLAIVVVDLLIDGDDDDHGDHDEDVERKENQFDRNAPVLTDQPTEESSEPERVMVKKFREGEQDSG